MLGRFFFSLCVVLASGVLSARDLVEKETRLRAFVWPEPGRLSKARIEANFVAAEAKVGKSALRVSYEFPDDKCKQVVLDFPLQVDKCYRKLEFRVKGDGSRNKLVVWLSAAGGWFGQGSVAFDFTDWRRIVLNLKETDTDVAGVLRFCIVQNGGLGRNVFFLDGIRFREPGPPRVKRFFVFGREIPAGVRAITPDTKKFKVVLAENDDRTTLLLDDNPLFCLLDVRFNAGYLRAARQCGVNAFALDLYWRNIEPRKGYREWSALREKLAELKRLGFGVILMFGPHQPLWWGAEHKGLAGALQGDAYPLSPAMVRDFGGILRELVMATRDFPNVIGYAVSAGGEQDSNFEEALGRPGPGGVWRRDPTCLMHYRDWLHRRYKTVDALKAAWGEEDISFETATPPIRLDADDYRRAWLDWAEFTNGWWVRYTDWVASLVRPLAPGKLLVARFGWPVFQAENIFLARLADVDLLQCKDAVAAWEVGHPGKQLSRTALYYGAARRSAKIVFPEMDILHGRGYREGDLSRYVPLFARFAGALWYYRGIASRNERFLKDLSHAVSRGKTLVRDSLGDASVGLFRSLAYANWISLHRNYENEAAMTGAAELFRDMALRYAAVSEYTLPDLFDFNLVVIPYNPAISATAERALRAYLALGGAVFMEANTGRFDLSGKRRSTGALRFAPVRVVSEQTAGEVLRFSFSEKGFPGKFSLAPGGRERVRSLGNGKVVGSYRDSLVVLKDRVLYMPCHFFASYSYGKGTDHAAARQVLSSFLRGVVPVQERMAKTALAETAGVSSPPSAVFLKRQAESAYKKGLLVRTVYLSRLAAAVSDRAVASGDEFGAAAGSLAAQTVSWVRAAARRVKRLPGLANEKDGPESRMLRTANERITLGEKALRGQADPVRALALLTVSYQRLVDLERGLRESSTF